MSISKAEEFARMYAGRMGKVKNTSDVPSPLSRPNPIGKVVGYIGYNRIIVEFIDGADREGSWNIDDDGFKSKRIVEDAILGWGVEIQNFELLEEEPISTIKVMAYPNTCKTCKSPSRHIRKTILCSNPKCKSRKKFNAKYKKLDKASHKEKTWPKKVATIGAYVYDYLYHQKGQI